MAQMIHITLKRSSQSWCRF